MSETGRALLQAIYDEPDDDTHRLVYADWLEDNGDRDRAEFIRLQLARYREDPGSQPLAYPACLSPQRNWPGERETTLLKRHFDNWTREARPFDPEKWGFFFRRGLLEIARFAPGSIRRTEERGRDEDLEVLARLPALQSLAVECNDLSDAATDVLGRLTHLRALYLSSRKLGKATLARLRMLRRLRDLSMEIGRLSSKCLEPISELAELESLCVNWSRAGCNSGFRFPANVLRHVAPLRCLKSLTVPLDSGNGDGLRHLHCLNDLRVLLLNGPAVTDAGIQHLSTLRNLRALSSQPSSITEAGARWLAERLPAVTIITSEFVVKSPRRSMRFRRCLGGEWASAWIPVDWTVQQNYGMLSAQEDGWEGVGSFQWSSQFWGGPAVICLWSAEFATAIGPEDFFREWREKGGRGGPELTRAEVFTRTPLNCPDWEVASWDCEKTWIDRIHSRHLICAATQGVRRAFFTCEMPPSRFDHFRPLFLFIARSVRLGGDAQQGVGEVIEVPMSEIERAAS